MTVRILRIGLASMKIGQLLPLFLILAQTPELLSQQLYLDTPSSGRVIPANEFTLGNLPRLPDDPLEPIQRAGQANSPNETDKSTAQSSDAAKKATASDVENSSAQVGGQDGQTSDGVEKEKDSQGAEKKDEAKSDEAKNDDYKKKEEKKWYEKISLRGYVQFRHNYPTFTETGSAPRQHAGDQSISSQQEFFIRRARLIFFGDIGEHLYLYVQPDLASTPNASVDQVNFAQIRDAYGDVYIDKEQVHRFRVGQSKIPYGWENLQSSQNRLSLDRADALNSAARNERDTGVFYYWTPKWAQDFFKEVNDSGLKGSGNYGIFALGAYNGQGGSLREQNDNLHVISRLTVPFETAWCKKWEVGMQGYSGNYVVLGSRIAPLGVGSATPTGTSDTQGHLDQRVA